MKKNRYTFFAKILLLFIIPIPSIIKAQYCVSGNCNSNTYINSTTPNTIEYDNMISVFHSSIVREFDGKIKVWGQGIAQNGTGTAAGHIAPPQQLNSINYGSGANQLIGDVLKFAGGSNSNNQQFAVLSTNGLYVWGDLGIMVPLTAANNVATGSFRKVSVGTYNVSGGATKADGLPNGVTPSDVKMMFGTRNGLAIVTCTGAAWVLSSDGNTYGDGATDNVANDILWHRVSTAANVPLTDIVAVRGTYQALMALTASGEIYTWGVATRLGNATAASNRPFATLMTKPAAVTPKMIGMTTSLGNSSYYLLATDGKLYAMGDNSQRQLGDGSTTNRNSWIQVTASNTIGGTTYTLNNNIVWISPQEHEGNSTTGYAAINVITNDGKLWAWGSNSNGMIAGNTAIIGNIDPKYMPGSTTGAYNAGKLNLADKLIAIETGGHTTLTIKQCSSKFGYVGHKIRGSMANNITDNGTENDYNYSDTAVLSVCGAVSVVDIKDLKVCNNTTANLSNALVYNYLPNGSTGVDWWADSIATIPVPNPAAVGPGVYYATFAGLTERCPAPMTVSYYTVTDPEYVTCSEVCTKLVDGESFSWSYNGNAPSNPVTQTFTQPAANYGFVLDIYGLDNSFNMDINGTLLAPQEMQFSTSAQSAPNIRFKSDGAQWQVGSVPAIWMLNGSASSPVIRVQISPIGGVKMYAKRNDNAALEELELFDPVTTNGLTFNTITWHTASSNTVIATQAVVGPTKLSGYGYGLNTAPCECIKPGLSGTPDNYTKVGILSKASITNKTGNINWPENVPNGHIVMDSAEKGFVITHMTTVQRDALTAVDGMLIYNTDLQCVQMYRGTTTPGIEPMRTGWNCIKRGCNE